MVNFQTHSKANVRHCWTLDVLMEDRIFKGYLNKHKICNAHRCIMQQSVKEKSLLVPGTCITNKEDISLVNR